jgi:hypothetical protein
MSNYRTIGIIGNAITGVTGGLTQVYSYKSPQEITDDVAEKERGIKITNPRSLADSIIKTTANLKGKQLSVRALRRAEARKLKPKYK